MRMDRRRLLRSSALASAGVAGGAAIATGVGLPQGNASSSDSSATYVFVHTGYASAAWWDGVVRELCLHGHRALAVDLPGHGPDAYFPESYQGDNPDELRQEESPAKDITVDDYAETVSEVVERASAHGPVILVGHGDAGPAAITRVANANPQAIAHLVYIDAYLCVDMPTIGEYLETPENEDAEFAPVVETPPELGIARLNWRSDDPETLEGFRTALAEGFSDEELRFTLNSMSPDIGQSLWGDEIAVDATTWGTIPRSYIRFTADRTIPLALQDRMIAEADALTPDNKFNVHSVNLPHVGPLDHPDIIEVLQQLSS